MQTLHSSSSQEESTYVLNAESAAEMNRLIRQDAFRGMAFYLSVLGEKA